LKSASRSLARVVSWLRGASMLCAICALPGTAFAAGTAVGTLIENTATVDFTQLGAVQTTNSNTVSFLVAERIDVVVTLQSGQVAVAPGAASQALLFTVTNTGNGSEAVVLGINSILAGDDFDPVPALPDSIFFDTDNSGDFNVGDTAYAAGVNDPVLAADESVDVLLVNDIPGIVVDGQLGRSELRATAATGSGAPGTVFTGQGDAGVDAVIGTTGGTAATFGEYAIDDVTINIVKSQLVSDPMGGTAPVVGATISYTISVEVIGAGIATAATINDVVPTWSTFVPDSITLNGAVITDTTDGDAGEYDLTGAPAVVVRLGDLTQADGPQSIVFQVTID